MLDNLEMIARVGNGGGAVLPAGADGDGAFGVGVVGGTWVFVNAEESALGSGASLPAVCWASFHSAQPTRGVETGKEKTAVTRS